MAKAVTKYGSLRTTGGGKFKLRVTYSISGNAITFTPYIVVTDAFTKKKTATVKWVRPNGTTAKYSKTVQAKKTTALSSAFVNKDASVKIRLTVGGLTSSYTISTTYPAKPTISAERKSDTNFYLSGYLKGSSACPITSYTVYRKEDYEDSTTEWESVKTWSGSASASTQWTFNDLHTERGHRYKYKIVVGASTGSNSAVTGWYYSFPSDISDLAHERTSARVNTVSWVAETSDVENNVITDFEVHCSENGEAFSRVATVKAKPIPEQGAYSYAHATKDDASYKYKVFPKNSAGTLVLSDETDTTYNTPAAPSSITGAYTPAGDIELKLENNPHTATALYIDRTADGGETWTNIAEIDETSEPCTTYTDTSVPSGSTLQYRARNYRDDENLPSAEQYSAWKESNEIRTASVPDAPTLINPYMGANVILDNGIASLMWIHNPTDGSDQSAYTVAYSVNGGAFTEVTGTTNLYYDLDLTQFAATDVISWKVKTKGAHADYSDYSETKEFVILTRPEIAFTSPSGGSTITELPLELTWTYTDTSGSLEELKVDVVRNDKVEKTFYVDVNELSYSLADFLFENEASYSLGCSARSSSGLTAYDEIGINIAYVPVDIEDGYLVSADINDDNGYITVDIGTPDDGGSSDAPDPDDDEPFPVPVQSSVVQANLYRVVNGHRTSLGSVTDGDSIEDRYAPVNRDFEYELLMLTQDGHVSYTTVTVNIASEYWFVYWENNIARAIWNPNGSVSISRPEKAQVRYSGRTYPVTYDSKAIEETYSFTGIITERAELDSFIRLMREGGQGIWKSGDGEVYTADFNFSYSADYTRRNMWNCTLDVTRIESEEL